MNARVFEERDVGRICRTCLCKGAKLIPVDRTYAVTNSEFRYAPETIGEFMIAFANVQVNLHFKIDTVGAFQSNILFVRLSSVTDYRRMFA